MDLLPLIEDRPGAVLALADGTLFRGTSLGANGTTTGEVVFNTSMTGYQEILTDPSYCRQIVTFTVPHVGNVGTNPQDFESSQVFAAGLVIRDCPDLHANFRATESLGAFLRREAIVAIGDIDTRRLTRVLRDQGAQAGAIVTGTGTSAEQRALDLARGVPAMVGQDLARVVSVSAPYAWEETAWRLGAGYGRQAAPRWHVVAYDFGIKRNILRLLAQRGCRITVVPAQTSASTALRLAPDGIFLSNGPGDPQPCDYAVEATRELVARGAER